MKKNKLFYWILLISVILFFIILKFWKIEFEYIYQLNITEANKLPFVIISSVVISILIFLTIKKRINFWSILLFLFLTFGIFTLNYIIITENDYKKFDFLISKKIENGKFEKYNDEGKNITQITNEMDTLFYHKYPIHEDEYNLTKSRFKKLYYLTKK